MPPAPCREMVEGLAETNLIEPTFAAVTVRVADELTAPTVAVTASVPAQLIAL